MAQRNVKVMSKKISSSRYSRGHKATTLEQLSSEIFFEVFDYLTGNEIYVSFFGLNSKIDQLVYNTPNVHLDLSQTRTRFYHRFQRIFCQKNIVSVVRSSYDVDSLERLLSPAGGKRLKSVSLLDVPLYTSQNRLPTILGNFKNQLISLKIDFSSSRSFDGENQIQQSFAYLLTELPLLKHLSLSGFDNMNSVGYMDSTIINNSVISLTLSVGDYGRWVPLLYRLQKLKSLTVHFVFQNQKKRVASRDSTSYYGCQIQDIMTAQHRFSLRRVDIYQFNMILENFERLFQWFVSPNLLVLKLFDCQRPFTRFPIPKRKSPFLDGKEWHDLTKKYLPSTMKRFYVEYEDVDNTMSMTNLARVKNDFIKYSGENLLWQVTCSFDQKTKLLSFDFNFI